VIVTQTPLRVGLVGGGTDLPGYYREHGGRVLNAAIDKYIYVIIKQRFDDDIYLNFRRRRSFPGLRTSSTSWSAGDVYDRRAQRWKSPRWPISLPLVRVWAHRPL
jgi:galactokinase/mevalonate kinase-like predicted kinase